MKRLIIILLSFLAIQSGVQATPPQETIIIGDVYDAFSGEPLPNVNIYFQGTSIGTTTNTEGLFLLRGHIDRSRTMVVSAVGYATERFRIEAGQQVGVEIALREKVSSLSDVFVYPGSNPALPIMEEVRRRRQNNEQKVDLEQVNAQTTLFVSDIQSKHLQRNLWKSLKSGMLQAEDSSYLIPLYWREQIGKNIDERATLLTLTDYQILLNQLHSTCNFYHNNVNILSTSFLSPLSSSGNTYYNYFLADSVQTADEKHYIIHFRTKNAFYATFNGEMAIDSATYALRSIHATVPVQTNINYLRQLNVYQNFAKNNQLQNENLSLLLDFAIKADTSRIFPTLLITRNTQIPITQNIDPLANQPLPIVDIPTDVSNAMDSLGNTPLIKTAKFLAYVIQTGCIPTNTYVEIGQVNEIIKYNKVEGLRIAIPLRTTEALWKNFSLGGFLAYSGGDRAWKGMGEMNIALPTKRRHTIQLRYSDHYVYSDVNSFDEYIRENTVFNPQINLVTELLRGVPFNEDYYYNTMVRRREGKLYFENDWNQHIETHAYLKVGRMGYGQPTINYNAQPSFFYTTLGGSARISFNERKVDSYFHRRYIYNHLPVLYLGAEIGSYQTIDMPTYRMYGNLQLMMRQKIDLGMAGSLEYLLQAGLIFGRVPYPLLHIFAGNQTHTFDMQRFSLMNTYQYAADQYIALHTLWDGKGILFNLIPGIRYLRLRELVEFKVAYGGLRNNHQSVILFPTTSTYQSAYSHLSAPTIPYVELGVGIGNILRLGEVYSIWRLTHINDPASPYWCMRFRLKLGL